jgi:hypothetical protein
LVGCDRPFFHMALAQGLRSKLIRMESKSYPIINIKIKSPIAQTPSITIKP